MKTITQIVTTMFEILNVDQVTDLLSDGIYRLKRGETSRGSCIVIGSLAKVEDVVSEGVLNVNIFAPNLSDNSVDEAKLEEITLNVVELIEAYDNQTNYMIFEIESQELLAEDREESFVNLRVTFFCEQ
jgi:hypothetical protein